MKYYLNLNTMLHLIVPARKLKSPPIIKQTNDPRKICKTQSNASKFCEFVSVSIMMKKTNDE